MADEINYKAAMEGVLKDVYLGTIRDQFPYGRVLDSLLENNSEDFDGLQGVVSIRLSPPGGVGYRSEDTGGASSALPDSIRQTVKHAYIPMAYLYATFAISGPYLASGKTTAGAFAKPIQDEMEQLSEAIRKYANVYNFLDGSGALAKITAIDGTTITVDRWCPLFEDTRKIDSFTAKSDGSQHLDGATISSPDPENLQFDVDAIGTAAVDDFIFVDGTRGVAQMGLTGIVDDGTFLSTHQGVSRTDNWRWRGLKLHNNGVARKLTEKLLTQAIAVARSRGINPDLIVGTAFQMADLCEELQLQRRFVNPEKKLAGGLRALEFNGVDFTDDMDAPPGYTWMLTKKDLAFFVLKMLHWMQEDGAILSRVKDSHGRKDSYEGTLCMYRELASYRNNSHIRIEDLEENKPIGF
jgi:hypothetical protein